MGKARLEPIGVLVFSVIMIVSFIQVGVEAVQRLLAGAETHQVVVLSLQSILIMISTSISFKIGVNFSCGKTWVLALVEVGSKFRSSGVGARCYE